MDTPIDTIALFNLLRPKIGEAEAQALTDYVERVVRRQVEEQKPQFTLRTEFKELKEDLQDLKLGLKDVELHIGQRISDQMKWMIGLFIPLYLSIIGLFITILLKR